MKILLTIIWVISTCYLYSQGIEYINIKQNKIKSIIVKSYQKDDNKRYNILNKTIFNFDNQYKLVNELIVEKQDTVLETYYVVDSLKNTIKSTYSKNQKIRHEVVDSLGNLIETCTYSSENLKLFCMNFSYEYKYDNLKLKSKKTFDKDKKKISQECYKYNNEDNIVKIVKYNAYDSIVNYTTYQYQWGLLTFEAYRDKNGSIINHNKYIYNSTDNIKEITKSHGVYSVSDVKIGSNVFVNGKPSNYDKFTFKYKNSILSKINHLLTRQSGNDNDLKYEYEYLFFK